MLSRFSHTVLLIVSIAGAVVAPFSSGFAQTTPAPGPLRVHPTNPRYFVDPQGNAVYLSGSHVWNNLQDGNGIAFDYNAYLNLIKNSNQNFIRLHVSETPRADLGVNPAPGWNGTSPWYQSADPLPYSRTGTGTAADGLPKFDLYRWNQTYFDRLRARVVAARDRGIYVGIMLFNAWTALNRVDVYPGRKTWRYHPFHADNNTNGVSGDPNGNGVGEETHTLQLAAVTQIQEAYVRKVIDTVNDLDNVIYEISHEDAQSDPAWQYHLINTIKTYESTKPKQHPVGMTGSPQIDATVLLNQPGSWTSFAAQSYNNPADPYAGDPPATTGARISLLDTDHIGYSIFRDNAPFTRAWVWKSFLRGHHTLLMEDLGAYSGWIAGRSAMGHTRSYAIRMNLGTMTPQNSLSTTGYCLASIGNEYLVYQDGSGAFSVNLATNAYTYEWFNPATGTVAATGTVGATGGNQAFTPPFQGPAVLYLKASGVIASAALPQEAQATATTYRASTDFSGIQGQRGWYYQDSEGRLMTYNAASGYWQGAETYLRIWHSGTHPGSSLDAVRRWVAPSAGTIRLTGRAADGDPNGGGGVTVLIRQGSTVLWQQALANGNTTGLTFDLTTTVTAGTPLDFIVNRGADGSDSYDSTIFDPTITYVTTTSATVSATVPPSVYSATLLWSPNTEADLAGYRVYQRTATGTYGVPVSVGKTTLYAATGLVSGVRYYFRVTAIDTSGNESVPSLEVSVLK